MNAAVFFDRDGVLIEDRHLITSWDQVELIPEAKETLLACHAQGMKVFLITNQPVVARGLMTLEAALNFNYQILERLLAPYLVSDIFTEIYLCPSHPDAQNPAYRTEDPYRKPRPGMILDACHKHQVYPGRSLVIGDRPSDIVAGNLAGCRTVLIEARPLPMVKSTFQSTEMERTPTFRVKSVKEVITIVDHLMNGLHNAD